MTMDFTFTAEQRELGDVVRAFLTRQWPETEVRRLLDDPDGFDRATWRRLANELGLQGLAVPERFGGSGFGPVELGVVFEELGRALAGGPFLASVALATTALLASGDDAACEQYLPGLVAGELVATLALPEDTGSWGAEDVATRADEGREGWELTGVKNYVLDGCSADLLLVVARSAGGVGLFAVDAESAGATLERTPLQTFDPTRRQARVELRATPARLIGGEGAGAAAVQQALRTGAVLLAAEQVGVAAWALDTAVAYAGIREQFGRPIGSFQAIKHKCADMLLRLEGARSASAFALWAAAERPEELPQAAAIAKSYCSEAASFCAAQCLQVHGGIGFTWEHPTHLYLKRAKSAESLLGSPARHRAELARLAGF
jgi:alkylation response protein AidB-like acyl-CoA dehydrogenase